jgi:hypothetical protein
MATVELRFYQELNDFLPRNRRFATFPIEIDGTPSVKDVIERCGVPHPEVDLVLVNGRSVGWGERLSGGERVAVYPVFESFNIADAQRLRPAPLREPRFVVDANLGGVVRLLRLLGFDVAYDHDRPDPQIVTLATRERRIILTRDRELLKRGEVTHGYYVRSTEPEEQAAEIVARFDLAEAVDPFTRCPNCGGELRRASRDEVAERVPPKSRHAYDRFFVCTACGQAYWEGTHQDELQAKLERVLAKARRLRRG